MIKTRPYEAIFWQIFVTLVIVMGVFIISGPFWAMLGGFIASVFLTLIWSDELKSFTNRLDKFTPLSNFINKFRRN